MSQHHEVQDCFPLVTTLSAWGTRIDVKNLLVHFAYAPAHDSNAACYM